MVGIDAVILWMLVLKFLPMFYSRASVYLFSPNERYIVFDIIPILLLGCYAVASVARRWKHSAYMRYLVIGFLGIFLIGSYLGWQLFARHATEPYLYIHDGAVQTEVAVAALRSGNNPYAVDYSVGAFGAFPDSFSYATRPNPAWDHYVYLPFPLLLGVPFSWAADAAFGWFDIRMMYAMLFVVMALSMVMLAREKEHKLLVFLLALFNPYFVQFFIAGFNDVFFLGLIALAAVLLQRRRLLWAAVVFGLAIASKQPAWFLFPFFAAFVYGTVPLAGRWKSTLKITGAAIATAALVMLPFFVWSPSHFIDSTIRYATGGAALSYPISGFGFGQLLVSSGVIHSMWDAYPFWIWQALIGIPLLVVLVRWQLRSNTVARMLLSFACLSAVLLFFSRYFNDSHLGMLSMLLVLAFAAGRFAVRHDTGPDV